MNALAHREVASYLNEHFVATYLKVGTFRIVNGQKEGGNVASYFCLPDGRVLHAVVGPVDAPAMLRESRWVLDLHKLATFECADDPPRYQNLIAAAHLERVRAHFFEQLNEEQQRRVHVILKEQPLVKVQDLYRIVFKDILREKISQLPVEEAH